MSTLEKKLELINNKHDNFFLKLGRIRKEKEKADCGNNTCCDRISSILI